MSGFIVVIPARMHSTRLPGKMLLDVCGLPLIVRTAKRARLTQASQVIVATDHTDIYNVCKSHDIEVVMTAEAHPSGTDRLAEVVQLLNLPDGQIVINIQGDEPLINPSLVDQLADFMAVQQTPIATLAHPIHDIQDVFNPNIVKVVLSAKSHALYFSRAPIAYDRDNYNMQSNSGGISTRNNVLRHIGVYAYTAGFLRQYQNLVPSVLESIESLEQLRALYYGYAISVMQTDANTSLGIDTQSDLIKVRQIIPLLNE